MKILVLILFTLPSSVYAESKQPNYTSECRAWGTQVEAYLPVSMREAFRKFQTHLSATK